MRRLLTPPEHRLPLIAAGAVPWALAFAVAGVRMADDWSPWVLTVVLALAAALPLALGALADAPNPSVTALLIAGLAVAGLAIARLTDALGADGALATPAALFAGAAAFAVLVALVRAAQPVPVLVLILALAAGLTVVAFVRWAFSPDGQTAYRWVLVALMVGYLAAHAEVRDRAPREGVLLLDASGLAALALAATFVGISGAVFGPGDVSLSFGLQAGAGWELVLLLAGFGLCAFAAVERQAGPGYLGVAVLVAFVETAGTDDGLLWWPLILLLGGVAAIGPGLRPARPLPPEPVPPGGPGETVPLRDPAG